MAGAKRAKVSQEFQRPVAPTKRMFFVNGELVRVLHVTRGMNIVYLYNHKHRKEQTMLLSDFKRHARRAYSLSKTAKILNRSVTILNRYIRAGDLKAPFSLSDSGEPEWQKRAYYSEDDIYEIRNYMATKHYGKPRKDGRITTHRVLTEAELRAKMGDALIMYTMTPEGEFIPTWREKTY